MNDPVQPTPSPRRERVTGTEAVARVADPTVTFLEYGSTLGILIAGHSELDTDGHSLEEVTWARCISDTSFVGRLLRKRSIHHTSFDHVRIYEFDAGVYVAEDQASRRFFPNPNHTPYNTRFISFEKYGDLLVAIRSEDVKSLYGILDLRPHAGGWLGRRVTQLDNRAVTLHKRFKDNLVGA